MKKLAAFLAVLALSVPAVAQSLPARLVTTDPAGQTCTPGTSPPLFYSTAWYYCNSISSEYAALPGGGGASTFTGLTDTPSSYTGNAGKLARVNATPNAIEFVAAAVLESELEAVLDLNECQGQIGDAQIADGAVDGGLGGEIADASITADDLGPDSVSASELNASGVASELEAVLTLSNLQGNLDGRYFTETELQAGACNSTTEKQYGVDTDGSPLCASDQGGSPGADSIGTSELDDGTDTPLSGEYVRVDTVDQAGFEYRTTAEVLADIGAAASAHTHVEANITDLSHTTDASALTSGTLADARVAQSNVTQHQAALSITESQISDLAHVATDVACGAECVSDSEVADNITASNYLPLAGGTLTGNVVTSNLGVEFTDSDTNPGCALGEYKIYADLSETKLKKCMDGSASDLDTTGGTPSFATLTGGTNTVPAAMVVGNGSSLSASGTGTVTATAAPWSGLTGVPAGFADNTDDVDDADASATNEIEVVDEGVGAAMDGDLTSAVSHDDLHDWVAVADSDYDGLPERVDTTTNGFVKTTGGTGTISIDTTTYLSALPSLTNGYFWIGDGTNTATARQISSDILVSNTGVATIQANSVALSTDTTGNYVEQIADAGNSTVAVTNGVAEGGSVTLDVINVNCNNCLDGTEIAELGDADVANALTIAGGSVSTSDITLKTGTTPTVDGRMEWDSTAETIKVGDDGVATLEFFPGSHTDDQVGTVTDGSYCQGGAGSVLDCDVLQSAIAGADHLDAMSEIAAGIKLGPDATDTKIVTTDVAAPAGIRCAQIDTDGSLILASDTCANLGPGGSLTVEEADLTPSVSSVTTLQFDQADGFVVTDDTGGVVEVDLDALPEANVSFATNDGSRHDHHDDDIPDTITASNYLPLAGGTLTGALITDNLGIDFEETGGTPTCAAGDFKIYAEGTLLKKCQNGSASNLDTTGGDPSFDTLTGGTNTAAAMVVGAGASLDFTSTGTINSSSMEGTDWGTLTDGNLCTYDSAGTEVDCSTATTTFASSTHASTHSDGGSDEIVATNLASACTDGQVLGGTSVVGGVECQADVDTTCTTGTNCTFDTSDNVAGAGLTYSGSTSGSTILKATATASGTLTLPAETGTVCSTGSVCSGYQANDNDLTAVADLSTTGYIVRTGAGTATTRTITTTQTGRLTIANQDGVSGNTLFSINYATGRASQPTWNAEECWFTNDGTDAGGFICEGSQGGNNWEQAHLFPATGTETSDTLDYIALSSNVPSASAVLVGANTQWGTWSTAPSFNGSNISNLAWSNLTGKPANLDEDSTNDLTTATTFGGDVGGTYNAITVSAIDTTSNGVVTTSGGAGALGVATNLAGLNTALGTNIADGAHATWSTISGKPANVDEDSTDDVTNTGATTGALYVGTGTDTAAWDGTPTLTGDLTLDDGTGDSPAINLVAEAGPDRTWTLKTLDAGTAVFQHNQTSETYFIIEDATSTDGRGALRVRGNSLTLGGNTDLDRCITWDNLAGNWDLCYDETTDNRFEFDRGVNAPNFFAGSGGAGTPRYYFDVDGTDGYIEYDSAADDFNISHTWNVTGDVAATGNVSGTWTGTDIALTAMAQMAENGFVGNDNGTNQDPQHLSVLEAQTLLNVEKEQAVQLIIPSCATTDRFPFNMPPWAGDAAEVLYDCIGALCSVTFDICDTEDIDGTCTASVTNGTNTATEAGGQGTDSTLANADFTDGSQIWSLVVTAQSGTCDYLRVTINATRD